MSIDDICILILGLFSWIVGIINFIKGRLLIKKLKENNTPWWKLKKYGGWL
jgi:hypothetical protein